MSSKDLFITPTENNHVVTKRDKNNMGGVIIDAMVIKVIDGDTIIIANLSKIKKFNLEKYEKFIIRITGIDCPEITKGNEEGRKYSQEAKDYVVRRVFEKRVRVEFLNKDPYNRWLALIYIGANDLGIELLQNGLAVIYRGRNAQYGGQLSTMEIAVAQAKFKKINIWSRKDLETPSEYKRRHRESHTFQKKVAKKDDNKE